MSNLNAKYNIGDVVCVTDFNKPLKIMSSYSANGKEVCYTIKSTDGRLYEVPEYRILRKAQKVKDLYI